MKAYLSSFLVAICFSVAIGYVLIPILRKLKLGQSILNYVTEHNYKSGTPTMGGLIFICSSVASFFIFACGRKYLSLVSLAVGLSYMSVGIIDDYIKIKLKHNKGLGGWQKTFFELVIAIIVAIFAWLRGLTEVNIPFTKLSVDLGIWFIPICILVFLATTNSVNLTDGLDGLAGGVTYIFFMALGVLICLQRRGINANAYYYEYANLSLFCFSISGAIVGYLLYNTHKASVFMGDTGSLALGGLVAILSIVSGNLLFIPVIGIIYVLSSISVIMQVAYYKKTKKRIFLMAPLHHHFQHKGYDESKIAIAYKLATLFLGLICIISYL
ncbi:MAG: phospho-N-acetylmuramoyl-pentapeptide-transferase [Clostridia bacterium]|nr:phospho-N-acetylmuramoyl-pentapeptide-transferase [Clostridia bacterium]